MNVPSHPTPATLTGSCPMSIGDRLQAWYVARLSGDRGQTTAEYALVVIGAATVAMLLIAWATDTGQVSTLLNKVVASVSDRIT